MLAIADIGVAMTLSNLQALRGVAALLVVAAHIGGIGLSSPALFGFPFAQGVIGVDIFFVLSGFVMALKADEAWGHGGTFLLRRAWRIYPVYWAALFLGAGLYHVVMSTLRGAPPPDIAYQIQSVFLLPAFNASGELYPALSVGWTLMYEMLFYVVMAVILTTTPRGALTLKLSIIFILMVILAQLLPPGAWRAFASNTLVFEFVLGSALFDIWKTRQIRWAWLLPLTGISAGVWLYTFPGDGWRFLTSGLFAFSILAAGLALERKKLAPKFLLLLGDASYSIYLIHIPAFFWAIPTVSAIDAPPMVRTLLLVAYAVACGVALHIAIEKPVLLVAKWVKKALRSGDNTPIGETAPSIESRTQ